MKARFGVRSTRDARSFQATPRTAPRIHQEVRSLDGVAIVSTVPIMSILQMKQQISRMSKRERQEIQAYLVLIKRNTPEWRRATAKTIREMKKGKFTTVEALESRLSKP
jgi:ATP-dependent helicase YprA (DUF1998 family)